MKGHTVALRLGRVGMPGHFSYCAEIKLRAERRAEELLAEAEKNKGAVTPSHRGSATPQLADLGITHNQSHRWQAVAGRKETFRSPPGMERCLQKLVLFLICPLISFKISESRTGVRGASRAG